MNDKMLDAIVIGAGQAGLGMSYFLQRDGRSHVVLERGRIGETWLSQRWDSFQLNTPNTFNALPGMPYTGQEPDGFWKTEQLRAYFNEYVDRFNLPVRTGVVVTAVEQAPDGETFLVKVKPGEKCEETLHSRSVVVAAGIQLEPKIPVFSRRIPKEVFQLHTADYRNPASLPPGVVIVVGGAQSGIQITEDLLAAGRNVYLCTSKVGRAPRRYRGRDIVEWLAEMRFFDVTSASLEDKSETKAPSAQVSGVGRIGHTVSYQNLARQGAVILGRLLDVEDGNLVLGEDASANVRFADEVSRRIKDSVDAYLAKIGITPPPLEDDPADAPDPKAECVSPLRRLDLREAEVGTILWATGFNGNLGWIHLPAFEADGKPLHQRGVSSVSGLYFLGFPWLHSRKSGIILGIEDDAAYLANAIAKQLG